MLHRRRQFSASAVLILLTLLACSGRQPVQVNAPAVVRQPTTTASGPAEDRGGPQPAGKDTATFEAALGSLPAAAPDTAVPPTVIAGAGTDTDTRTVASETPAALASVPAATETGTPVAASTQTPAPPASTPPAVQRAGTATATAQATMFSTDPHPLQIAEMRRQAYPGSPITVEQKLDAGANYSRQIVSYRSDGYKIYALMTVPDGPKPSTGWPVIVFNHGYIPPAQYRTTERYVAYVDAIARSGYIVFKPDYRGHGNSEGSSSGGGYGRPGYTNDVLNAVTSLKSFPDADVRRIGMWGHSMGGQLTLRAMVVTPDIKAGVIWGGVVAPYPDIFGRGNLNTPAPGSGGAFGGRRGWRQELTGKYGSPEQNPQFWASISPNSYLGDISGPLQLHHSTTDEEVPVAASRILKAEAQALGQDLELFTYPGDNHNINGNFALAMQRTVAFFDKYVKGS